MCGCLRRLNFGLLWTTEFLKFTRMLELSFVLISGKILFKLSPSMHDDYRFLSWVADPWTWSTFSTVWCPRLMNFGISLRAEFARFTRKLELNSFLISGKILFTPTSSMHDDYRFLSWVADPWTWVSNFSLLPVQLSKLEVVSLLGLKTYLFTPGVSILLIQLPLMFLLSLGVLMILFDIFTDSFCGPITIVSDWRELS